MAKTAAELIGIDLSALTIDEGNPMNLSHVAAAVAAEHHITYDLALVWCQNLVWDPIQNPNPQATTPISEETAEAILKYLTAPTEEVAAAIDNAAIDNAEYTRDYA